MDRDANISPSWNPRGRGKWPAADFLDWNLWGGWPKSSRRHGDPTIDLYETQDEMVIEADVPGFDPKDISIRVSPQSLVMTGKTESRREQRDEGYFLRERGFGQFFRTVGFPAEVVADKAKAKYKDGVLRVTAPKAKQGDRGGKDIPIERD